MEAAMQGGWAESPFRRSMAADWRDTPKVLLKEWVYCINADNVRCPVNFITSLAGIPARIAFVAKVLLAVWLLT